MANRLIARLQAMAPTIVPQPVGEQFLIYWTRLVLKAGVDLFAKANLPEREEIVPGIVCIADDLNLFECLQVALYLESEMSRFCGKIDAEILRREAKR